MKISITNAAKQRILELGSQSNSNGDLVPSLAWYNPTIEEKYVRSTKKSSVSFKRRSHGYWWVGWYERSNMPGEYIRNLDGIEVVFEGNPQTDGADNVRIDFLNNEFVVTHD